MGTGADEEALQGIHLEKLSDSAKSELSMARNDREQTQRLMYQNTLDQLRTKQWSVEQQKALDASSG